MPIDERTVEELAKAAGIHIREDEMAGAVADLQQMMDFAEMLDTLPIAEASPATVFDPSWRKT